MKNYRLPILVLISAILFPVFAHAAKPVKKSRADVVWTKRASKLDGLYTQQNSAIANGLTFSLNGLYYYGDVDRRGLAMNGGFQTQNVTFGGAASFAYTMPAGRHTNWRFGLNLGTLRGDNSKHYTSSYRKFNSMFGELSAGVEWYPFPTAGFYLYGGVALTYSYIHYDYMSASGKRSSVLPLIPLEVGYDFKIGRSIGIKVNFSVHQGIIDTPICNLDGYPMNASQNSAGIDFGRGGGNKWADGFFQIGISFTYRWHNCEACRLYRW